MVLLIAVTLLNSVWAKAKENDKMETDISYARQVASFFIKSSDKKVKITDEIVINNLFQKPEVVLFELGENGYLIVNIHDLSVPEMSFDNKNPYHDVKEPIYNGPLHYYYIDNGEYVSIDGSVKINIKEITEFYTKKECEDKEEYVKKLLSTKKDSWGRIKSEKIIRGLKKWRNPGHCCGAVASAIYMRYMYDYVNPLYGRHRQVQENAFIIEMQRWVGPASASEYELCDGLNDYLFNYGLSIYDYDDDDDDDANWNEARMCSYSFFAAKSRINYNRPVIQKIRDYIPGTDHWVLTYGYCIYPGNAEFIIINDGNGSDGIYIEADDSYLGEMVYLIR